MPGIPIPLLLVASPALTCPVTFSPSAEVVVARGNNVDDVADSLADSDD
ncbi:hypothetical protein [Nocardia jiangxiensis]|uniref:Uncharacterized protein n=1 Tax=Nocardia jiangxiensis TaxID=282685 RepID=A0ABW6RZS9_9NOCA|nr:hypothetical protein [Nocardia jiangxiensis]